MGLRFDALGWTVGIAGEPILIGSSASRQSVNSCPKTASTARQLQDILELTEPGQRLCGSVLETAKNRIESPIAA